LLIIIRALGEFRNCRFISHLHNDSKSRALPIKTRRQRDDLHEDHGAIVRWQSRLVFIANPQTTFNTKKHGHEP
jgi:hypothetical protein